nr:MAG: hypothetical protein [Microvirus Sku18]
MGRYDPARPALGRPSVKSLRSTHYEKHVPPGTGGGGGANSFASTNVTRGKYQ